MKRQPPVALRLITDHTATIDDPCTLCLFLHGSQSGECQHDPYLREFVRPQSHISNISMSTARTTEASASDASSNRVKAKVIVPPPKKQPALRHKASPTDSSLRELRTKQAQQTLIRERKSEERLQHAYESQILAYLESL